MKANSQRPTLYFPFFGTDPRYLALLRKAWDSYHASGSAEHIPAVILIDERTPPPDFGTYAVANSSDYGDFIREDNQGRAFDRKAALIMAAIEKFNYPWPTLFADIDNEFRHNIAPHVEKIRAHQIMVLPPIPESPLIVHPRFGLPLPEMTSALIYFPAFPKEYGARYRFFFKTSSERDHVLLEQRTWSLVWHSQAQDPRYMPVAFPREMSWSRMWGEENEDVVVRHRHGQEKFENLRRVT